MTTHASHFQNAHHLNINQLNISTSSGTFKSAIDHLSDNCAFGALYNSRERSDAPKCHPETRVAVQSQIVSWITHGDRDQQPKRILWLSGPAGAGKTAIAGSVAKTCSQDNGLAATFFFSSFSESANRRTKRCVIATLAYQLIQCEGLQGIRDIVLSAIQQDPAIFEKSLEHQLEELILKPLRQLERTPESPDLPLVIILDGLDEVEGEKNRPRSVFGRRWRDDKESDQVEILQVILTAVKDPAFPFRIFISSRPEHAIQEFLDQAQNQTLNLFLDERYNADADIELFLRSKFAELRREFEMSPLWPSDSVIRTIIQKASGQFIFAATVIRYITNGSSPPDVLLKHILALSPQTVLDNPLSLLDAVYTHVLMSSPNPKLAVTWILTIIHTSLSSLPASFCKQFLESSEGEGKHLLRNLASLLSIPPIHDRLSRYKIYHKSLTDFLGDPNRCSAALHVPEYGVGGYRHFYLQRYIAILRGKGPSRTIIDKSDLVDFLHRFCCLSPNPNGFGSYPHSIDGVRLDEIPNDELAPCDLDWWVRQWVQSYNGSCSNASCIPELCSLVFWSIHKPCPWYRCRPLCKLWRQQIIRSSKSYGWKVPAGLFKRINPTSTGRYGFGGDIFRVSFDEIDENRGRILPPGRRTWNSGDPQQCICTQDPPSSSRSTSISSRPSTPRIHTPPSPRPIYTDWPPVIPVVRHHSGRSSTISRSSTRSRSPSLRRRRRRSSTPPRRLHLPSHPLPPPSPSRRSTRSLSPSWPHIAVIPPPIVYSRSSDRTHHRTRSPTPSSPHRRGRSPISRRSSTSEHYMAPIVVLPPRSRSRSRSSSRFRDKFRPRRDRSPPRDSRVPTPHYTQFPSPPPSISISPSYPQTIPAQATHSGSSVGSRYQSHSSTPSHARLKDLPPIPRNSSPSSSSRSHRPPRSSARSSAHRSERLRMPPTHLTAEGRGSRTPSAGSTSHSPWLTSLT